MRLGDIHTHLNLSCKHSLSSLPIPNFSSVASFPPLTVFEMPTLRNPFRKAGAPLGGLESVNDENSRPVSQHPAERASFPGSKSSVSILSLKSKREETNEYKLSGTSRLNHKPKRMTWQPRDHAKLTKTCAVVNDSGVYLPVCIPFIK